MKKFLQEFQTFISRGNVLDLAVAVIIGAAFSAIVNSLVKDLINPLCISYGRCAFPASRFRDLLAYQSGYGTASPSGSPCQGRQGKGRGGSGGQTSSDARRHRAATRNSRSIERGLCQEVLTEARRGCLRVDQTGLSMSMNVTSMSVSVAIRSPRARTPKRSVAWCPQAK